MKNPEQLPEHWQSKSAIVIGALAIAAYDVWCPEGETISEGFDRMIDKHPLLTLGGIAVVGCHLANIFQKLGVEHLDLLHRLTGLKALSKKRA